jgi:protein SCO1/2
MLDRTAAIVVCAALALACLRTERDSYPLSGRVVAVDAAAGQVTIAHDVIPGFMPAMTMPFEVQDPAALAGVARGDLVAALLRSADSRFWLEQLEVTQKGTAADAGPDATAPGYRTPQPGEAVPDVALTNQDGRKVRLSHYRGRALALTFIFTRCPIPDFCPRMSHHFVEVEAALRSDPELAGRAHLLSVSFDTEYDTPEVLKAYGRGFLRGADGFEHWDLAGGDAGEIRRLADFLGLDYEEESGQFTHNLRTAVITPDGKLFRVRRGNDWTPQQLVQDLKEAALNTVPSTASAGPSHHCCHPARASRPSSRGIQGGSRSDHSLAGTYGFANNPG